jgi:hypothetical protein
MMRSPYQPDPANTRSASTAQIAPVSCTASLSWVIDAGIGLHDVLFKLYITMQTLQEPSNGKIAPYE